MSLAGRDRVTGLGRLAFPGPLPVLGPVAVPDRLALLGRVTVPRRAVAAPAPD